VFIPAPEGTANGRSNRAAAAVNARPARREGQAAASAMQPATVSMKREGGIESSEAPIASLHSEGRLQSASK
jgi:hypothetical protein